MKQYRNIYETLNYSRWLFNVIDEDEMNNNNKPLNI